MPDTASSLLIQDVRLTKGAEYDEVSALIGDCRLWYRFTPGYAEQVDASAFIAVGLLAAMASNMTLELAAPVTASPLLLSSFDRLQEIFHIWNPALHRVTVRADARVPVTTRQGCGSFFSGGVDGLYTFLQHEQEITHLIQLHGYEYRHENRALGVQAEAANREYARARGKELIIVETNIREIFEAHNVHIYTYHGACLASVAHLLGFPVTYVPSSFTWADLAPWGSHPLTDPLWSTEAVTLRHDGCEAHRAGKLRRIGKDATSLASLRVCPQNSSMYNCGVCEKCLRTRVLLRMLGLSSPTLPPLDDPAPISRMRFGNAWKRQEWVGNLSLAIEVNDRAVARAIAWVIAKYDVRHGLRSLDRALFGGRLRRRFGGGAAIRDKPFPIEPVPPEV